MLFVGLYLRRRPSQPFSGKLFFALLLQTTASVAVWVMASPLIGEFLFWETFIWGVSAADAGRPADDHPDQWPSKCPR